MNEVAPSSFENALKEAELSCFAFLCDRCNLRQQEQAFVSTRPKYAIDCAVFDIGQMQTGDVAAFPSGHYHWRAQCDFYNRSRDELQRMIMRMLRDFPVDQVYNEDHPLRKDTCVQCFRIAPETGAISTITTQELDNGKDASKVPVFTCTVQFDVVFYAGPRQ